MNWKSYLAGVGMAALVAGGTTWQVQSWRYQAQLATISTAHQIELNTKDQMLQAMKNEAIQQVLAQQAQQQEQAKRIATLDAKHYKDLRHAQDEATRLRADLASGRLGLYVDTIPAKTQASGNTVPAGAGTSSVAHGTVKTELHPTTAERLVGIAGDADECARKLIGLQAWVSTQTSQ